MQRRILLILLLLPTLFVGANAEYPGDASHGQVHASDNGVVEAWDADSSRWVNLETFWLNYADSRGGLTWEQSREYPPFDGVSEHDLLLIELDSGICLMEFFHGRWRRAQDVRRWSEAFNQYSGCKDVFK